MDSTFHPDGIRTSTKTNIKGSEISALKLHWQEYISNISSYPGHLAGKGIVFCAGGPKYFTCCWVAVNTLKDSGCELPIEVWYYNHELSHEMIGKLSNIQGLTCKNIADYVDSYVEGMIIKPLSILYSAFEEVMFIDLDNICVKDPTYLFDDSNYKNTGTIFWPDYWRTSNDNPIWEVLEVDFFDGSEQESGQILINKAICWKELNLCVYFNIMGKYYYQLIHGDKDTFKYAWLALKRPYYMVKTEVATCGLYIEGRFEGNTMVQHDPQGKIIFLHRNLYKWDITDLKVRAWQTIRKFVPDTNNPKKYFLYFDKYIYFNFGGEIVKADFVNIYPRLELACLKHLQQLRKTKLYKNLNMNEKRF